MTNLIYDSETGLLLNGPMINYMDDIMNKKQERTEVVNNLFQPNSLPFANKSIKNGNYYMLDKYNLVIRKAEQNKTKSAYGWVYNDNNEPINIHIKQVLIETNSNDITIVTLQYLKSKFPNIFKSPRGQLYKIYAALELPGLDIDKI